MFCLALVLADDEGSMMLGNDMYGGYLIVPESDSTQKNWEKPKNVLEYKTEIKLQSSALWWNDSAEVAKRKIRAAADDRYDSVGRTPYVTSEGSPWPKQADTLKLPGRYWRLDDRFHGVVEVPTAASDLPSDSRHETPRRIIPK